MTMVRKILVLGMALTLLTAGLAWGAAEPIKIGAVSTLHPGSSQRAASESRNTRAAARVPAESSARQ